MHKINLVIALTAISISIPLPCKAEWIQLIGSTTSFDKDRITKIKTDTIKVWTKYILPNEALDYVKSKGLESEYVDYSYSIAQRLINCRTKAHGFSIITNFNSHGIPSGPTATINEKEVEMTEVLPESEAEELVRVACIYAKKTK